jgi:sRNA-binding regulator protein Hfq
MSNKNSLIGKSVSLFLDGGWEIAGEVKSSDDDKFVVERDGDLFMVFKNKISCLLVTEKARALKAVKAYSPTDRAVDKSAGKASPAVSDSLFPMNGISYEESAMSIPGGLLDDIPDNSDDDFSVIFKGENSSLEDEKLKNIEFMTEDDTKN